jgi:ATP-dependent Clp protease ATP-binding subunit ClpA
LRTPRTTARPRHGGPEDVLQELSQRVVGQSGALTEIIPYVQMFRAGLAPEGRPAGVFLLLGPTGTGKTRTVEALADVLHGSDKHLVRVDCGEFQMEHEVAKLTAATSENSNLALILFDEIEKSAPSMTRLLLGVLDKAILRLGDNTMVNFERTLIFLTSNLGAEAMRKELAPDFGFEAVRGGTGVACETGPASRRKLEAIGMGAVKRKFSPEFVNRIDAVITYHPLEAGSLEDILDLQLAALERHIRNRLEERAFEIDVTDGARAFLLRKGTSQEYGARELKRTILRRVTQPLAALVESGRVPAGSVVVVEYEAEPERLLFEVEED